MEMKAYLKKVTILTGPVLATGLKIAASIIWRGSVQNIFRIYRKFYTANYNIHTSICKDSALPTTAQS